MHCIADIVLLSPMVSGRGKRNKDILLSVHGGKAGQTQPCSSVLVSETPSGCCAVAVVV